MSSLPPAATPIESVTEPDLLGERARAGERGLLQQNREFIAPGACGDVAPLDVRLQCLADRAQDLVPEQVAVLVVDLLEVIDVRQHQGRALEGTAGVAELPHRELEAAAVTAASDTSSPNSRASLA